VPLVSRERGGEKKEGFTGPLLITQSNEAGGKIRPKKKEKNTESWPAACQRRRRISNFLSPSKSGGKKRRGRHLTFFRRRKYYIVLRRGKKPGKRKNKSLRFCHFRGRKRKRGWRLAFEEKLVRKKRPSFTAEGGKEGTDR